MASGFIVRLRPNGPWRLGPPSGARERVDRVAHSDTLYSALTIAANQLGFVPEWLAATAEAEEPIVRVGSAYPFVGRTLLAPAPRHVWPATGSGRVRWKAARFVPLHIVPRLLAYETLKEDRWAVDPVSEAVLPVEKFGEITPPFRVSMRRTAAVDRVSGVSGEAASTACLEFAENAGMWCPVFCTQEWRPRVETLFRWLADSGIGGERSLGWGRSAAPEFEELPAALAAGLPDATEHHEIGYWLLSLFAPAPSDRVDWNRGSYALVRRSGRTDSGGELKAESAMVEEGSVVIAEVAPSGIARNIAPEGHGHAVYRAGLAVAVPVLVRLPGFSALERPGQTETPAIPVDEEPVAAPDAVPVSDVEAPDVAVPDVPTPDVPTPEVAEAAPVKQPDPTPETEGEQPVLDAADEVPFETADVPRVAETLVADEGQIEPPSTEAEPLEDALAAPEPLPEPELFVVETQPTAEQIPPSPEADGGAFEDGPAIADADGVDRKPEEEQ